MTSDPTHDPSRERKRAVNKPDEREPLPDGRDEGQPLPDGRGSDQYSHENPSRERKRAVNKRAVNKRPDVFPLAYHITIHCYGTRLHGDEAGSVHHSDNISGTPFLPPRPGLRQHEEDSMNQPPYELDTPRRAIVLKTTKEVCSYRGWDLYAVHVRTNHWHVVVQAMVAPEKVMGDLKAYASRNLNQAGFDNKSRKRWSRHGSTKYKWTEQDLAHATDYVIREQGEPLDLYEKPL